MIIQHQFLERDRKACGADRYNQHAERAFVKLRERQICAEAGESETELHRQTILNLFA